MHHRLQVLQHRLQPLHHNFKHLLDILYQLPTTRSIRTYWPLVTLDAAVFHAICILCAIKINIQHAVNKFLYLIDMVSFVLLQSYFNMAFASALLHAELQVFGWTQVTVLLWMTIISHFKHGMALPFFVRKDNKIKFHAAVEY